LILQSTTHELLERSRTNLEDAAVFFFHPLFFGGVFCIFASLGLIGSSKQTDDQTMLLIRRLA